MQPALQDTVGRWTTRQIHDTVAAIARQRTLAPARQIVARSLHSIRLRADRRADRPDSRIDRTLECVVIAGDGRDRARDRRANRRRSPSGRGVGPRGARGGGSDRAATRPGPTARELAAAGDYTGACHALYAAVLEALARDGALKRHASKTSGDYVRELRMRGSPVGCAIFAHSPATSIASSTARAWPDDDDYGRLARPPSARLASLSAA